MIKYTVITKSDPMDEDEIQDQYKKGRELINVVRRPDGRYNHYLQYRSSGKPRTNIMSR